MTRGLPWVIVTLVLLLAVGPPARAWTPIAEGDKGRLDFEARFMFWAVETGPDDLPSGTSSPAQEENIQDFFLRRGRLLLRGQASSGLELYVQVGQDYAGSKVYKDDSGLRIKDFYLNYRKADAVQVMVGQFKVPFLRHNLQSGFNQLLVDRAAVAGLRPALEGSRDLGGMLWGNHGGFQYRAAVFDGSDQEDNDARSSLRGAARVSYNWFTPETGVAYTGTTVGQKRILQIGAQIDTQAHRTDSKDGAAFTTLSRHYRARAGELFYDQPFGKNWALTLEAAWAGRRDAYDDAGVSTRRVRGYYAQAGLLFPFRVGPGRLQVVSRYEALDEDRGGVGSGNLNRAVGLTYFGKGHDRKIQLDYTQRRETPADLDNDELRLSVVAVF